MNKKIELKVDSRCPDKFINKNGQLEVCHAWMDWRDDNKGNITLKCRTCGYTILLNLKKVTPL